MVQTAPPSSNFTDISDKIGLTVQSGSSIQGTCTQPLRMADKQKFHAGTNVHQYGAWIFLHQLERLLR